MDEQEGVGVAIFLLHFEVGVQGVWRFVHGYIYSFEQKENGPKSACDRFEDGRVCYPC